MAQSKQIIPALVQKPFVTGLAPAFPLFFVPPPLSLSPFLASFPLSPKWQSWQIISFAIAWERGGRSVGGGPRSAIIPLLSPPPPPLCFSPPSRKTQIIYPKRPQRKHLEFAKGGGPLAISVHTQGAPLRPTFTARDFFPSFRSQSCLHYTRFSYIAVKKGVGASFVSLLPTQPNCEMLLPQESLPFIPSPPFTPCCSRCRKLTFFEFGIHPLSPGKTTKKPAF